MKRSTISVIIPTYNRAALIKDAIDSVLKQETAVDEIIVVDDGSTDSTAEQLAIYKDQIRIIRQANAGPSAARNRGIREATMDLIAFQDSDDIWKPNKITRQLDYLKQYPKIDLLFSDFEESRDGSTVRSSVVSASNCAKYLRTNHSNLSKLFNYLLTGNPIICQSVMLRRSLVEHVGYFDESLWSVEDRDYWLRWVSQVRTGYLDEILVERRLHDSNITCDTELADRSLLKVIESWANKLPIESLPDCPVFYKRGLGIAHFRLGSHHFRRGEYAAAWSCFNKSLTYNFWQPKCLLKLAIATPWRLFSRSS